MEETYNEEFVMDDNIMELIDLLKNNGYEKMYNNLVDTISYIDVLQDKIDSMTKELSIMRHQLDDIQIKQDMTVTDEIKEHYEKAKSDIRGFIDKTESKLEEVKQDIHKVVALVKEKAKETVKEFRDKGKVALAGMTELFGVKETLSKVQWKIHIGILDTDKMIRRIDYYMENMKQAKMIKKNAKNVLRGKAPNATEDIKMPFMEFAKKAYYWQKGVYQSAEVFAETSADKVEELMKEAERIKSESMDKDIPLIQYDSPVNDKDNVVPANMNVAEPKVYGADAFEAFANDMEKGKADSKLVRMVMEEFAGRSESPLPTHKTDRR